MREPRKISWLELRFRMIDIPLRHAHTAPMYFQYKKFLAVLMLLWLPIFTGSALAASVAMELKHSVNHVTASTEMLDELMAMGECPMQHVTQRVPAGGHSQCGVCHFVGAGYLPALSVEMLPVQIVFAFVLPARVIFNSVTSTPLLPPPLFDVAAG